MQFHLKRKDFEICSGNALFEYFLAGISSKFRFRYFWTGILENYCHILNQHSQICEIKKFYPKQKTLSLRPTMPDEGIFRSEFELFIAIFEISTLEFIINEFIINTLNCGIRSTFSKGLGLAFS